MACVDLSNYAERKHKITKQLMEAATTVGCVSRVLKVPDLDFPKHSEMALGTRTTELTIWVCSFFYVVGHGMPQEAIDRCFATTKK